MLPERIELQLNAAVSSEWNTVCFGHNRYIFYSLLIIKIQSFLLISKKLLYTLISFNMSDFLLGRCVFCLVVFTGGEALLDEIIVCKFSLFGTL